MRGEKAKTPTSVQTLKRMPYYLKFLKTLDNRIVKHISSTVIAGNLGLNEVQVRKDLASVSKTAGRPRTGFAVSDLIRDIENFLGYDNRNEAVLVGAGNLGKALYLYRNFKDYGLEIVAAFDSDPRACGEQAEGKPVFPLGKLPDLCGRMKIKIGIIAVPAESAQDVCDLLVAAGILVIWNFSPVNLVVPDSVYVKDENMASSIAILTKSLSDRLE